MKKFEWQSVANVPLLVEVIELDTISGDVMNVKYIRQPDDKRAARYYWIEMPKRPTPSH